MKFELPIELAEQVAIEVLRGSLKFLRTLPKKERDPGDPALIEAFKQVLAYYDGD